LENSQLLGLLRQLALQAGIFGSQLILPFGRRFLLLNFAAPGIKLRLIKGELAATPIRSASFRASLRYSGEYCFLGFLLTVADLVM